MNGIPFLNPVVAWQDEAIKCIAMYWSSVAL